MDISFASGALGSSSVVRLGGRGKQSPINKQTKPPRAPLPGVSNDASKVAGTSPAVERLGGGKTPRNKHTTKTEHQNRDWAPLLVVSNASRASHGSSIVSADSSASWIEPARWMDVFTGGSIYDQDWEMHRRIAENRNLDAENQTWKRKCGIRGKH